MTTDSDDELLALLGSVAGGGNPAEHVPRIRELVATAPSRPWLQELAYVLRHFTVDEPETTEALVAIARKAVARYPCPACEQIVLDEPAWNGESPSHEICPSCGIEFGYDDMSADSLQRSAIYRRWREAWLANGRRFV